MRSADRHMGRRLRWALIATAVCAWSAPVLAGGPLYVVPANGTMKPARWEGTVKVYTDRGDLGAVDHATANQLVASALAEWSSVPTSSFRAQVAGELGERHHRRQRRAGHRCQQRRRDPGDLRP